MSKVFIGCLLIILSITKGALATELNYADYANLPALSLVEISPSGERLAYRSVKGDKDMLIIIDINTKKIINAIEVGSVNPYRISFVTDDRLILMVAHNTRESIFVGRIDVSASFSYNLITGDLHQVMTAGYGIYIGQTSLGRVMGISPDKKYAYMTAWKDPLEYSLFKVSLTKKKRPRLMQKGTVDTRNFFINSHGQVIARERYHNKKNRHILEARHNDEWVNIFEQRTEIQTVSFNGITPDGKSLMMKRKEKGSTRWAYHTISLKDGSISKPIFSRDDRDVERLLTDLNGVVYGVQYSGFKPSYEFFDERLNKRMAGIDAVLPDNGMRIVSYTPDWSNIVFYLTGTDSSGEYLRYKSGHLEMLAQARPAITTDKVHPVAITQYKARDGLTIPTLLTLPVNKKPEKLPAIMLPHGGPEHYDTLDFYWLSQYFSNQGYAVIQPQFRGSTGFGSQHQAKGRGEWGRKMQDDLTDAVSFYVNNGTIDPKRVCIVGASYGGYAALAGAVFTPDLYRCVVSINGVSDIERMITSERDKYGRNHWVMSYWDRVIANGSLEDDHFKNISPINFVKNITAPVLLIHGEHDSVVNVSQSRNMLDQMEDQNKAVTYVELDNGDHYLSKATNRANALKVIADFVDKHLK